MSASGSTTTAVVATTTSCPNTLAATDTEALISVGAGTFVGVTGKVQASHNGTDYFDWPFYDVHGALQDAGTTITLTDSTAAFIGRMGGLAGMAKCRFLATGWTSGSAPVTVTNGVWGANSGVAPVQAAGASAVSSITSSGLIKSTSATAGIGYATGAGGTVTQATDRSTGVTLNKVTGAITTNNASLAAGAEVSFTVTNSAVAAADVVAVSITPGGTGTPFAYVSTTAAGSFQITLTNLHASTADTSADVISFVVVKGVTS
jgi:hypothetical protein